MKPFTKDEVETLGRMACYNLGMALVVEWRRYRGVRQCRVVHKERAVTGWLRAQDVGYYLRGAIDGAKLAGLKAPHEQV